MSGFGVETDRRGRIQGFTHPELEGVIVPGDIAQYVRDSSEAVLHRGAEYKLTRGGNLIHAGLEIDQRQIVLGSGVLIGVGVEFDTDRASSIVVGDGTRLEGVRIEDGVSIGMSGVIFAQEIKAHATLGDSVRVGQNSVIGEQVVVEGSVKIDTNVWVGPNARIGFAANLGHGVRVERGVRVGRHHNAGRPTGSGNVQRHKSAPVIARDTPNLHSPGRLG